MGWVPLLSSLPWRAFRRSVAAAGRSVAVGPVAKLVARAVAWENHHHESGPWGAPNGASRLRGSWISRTSRAGVAVRTERKATVMGCGRGRRAHASFFRL